MFTVIRWKRRCIVRGSAGCVSFPNMYCDGRFFSRCFSSVKIACGTGSSRRDPVDFGALTINWVRFCISFLRDAAIRWTLRRTAMVCFSQSTSDHFNAQIFPSCIPVYSPRSTGSSPLFTAQAHSCACSSQLNTRCSAGTLFTGFRRRQGFFESSPPPAPPAIPRTAAGGFPVSCPEPAPCS